MDFKTLDELVEFLDGEGTTPLYEEDFRVLTMAWNAASAVHASKVKALEQELARAKGLVDLAVDCLFAMDNSEFVTFCGASLSDIKAEFNKALADYEKREGKG